MKVRQILASKGHNVVTIGPEAHVSEAIEAMRRDDIGALVVVDGADHLVGMLSEREITRSLASASYRMLSMRVAQVMNRTIISCESDDDVYTVMTLMTHARARHLPVVDHGQLTGIVSLGDVVKSRLEEVEMEVQVLRDLRIASS
jgi:CBS domain-containing protein